jgi:exopolysaccharide production protein ExoY
MIRTQVQRIQWDWHLAPRINGMRCRIQHDVVKRIFDFLFSVTVLSLLLPFLALIAAAIKIKSPGPILFSHTRIGRGGRPFQCLKFRSMYIDAEERLEKLLASDAALRNEWDRTHKLKNDPRILPFGEFLRKTSLDELPQFWNVIKGDLSVVGPRPVVQKEVSQHFGAKAAKILSIRPGITGLWQTSGRSSLSYPERVALEATYVERRSFLLDLQLVLRTVPAMLSARGAY